jgi:hypothetical protein
MKAVHHRRAAARCRLVDLVDVQNLHQLS